VWSPSITYIFLIEPYCYSGSTIAGAHLHCVYITAPFIIYTRTERDTLTLPRSDHTYTITTPKLPSPSLPSLQTYTLFFYYHSFTRLDLLYQTLYEVIGPWLPWASCLRHFMHAHVGLPWGALLDGGTFLTLVLSSTLWVEDEIFFSLAAFRAGRSLDSLR